MPLIAIYAKTIFTPLEIIGDGIVVAEDGVIRSVGSVNEIETPKNARVVDFGDRILSPGFIDIHIHGAGGHDVMEGTADAVQTVAAVAAQHGTTSFLPTTMTAPVPVLLKSLEALGSQIGSWNAARSSGPMAQPLGIHMEGPFLNGARRGVHPCRDLQKPSASLFRQLFEAAGGKVSVLTVAPELEGAAELQAIAGERGVKVALGHSDATFGDASRAIEAGASHAVHMFNAMRPFGHRDPGIIGAVLTDDRVSAEVIADGVHVSAPALRLLVRAKGNAGVVLVTDGVSATGMGAGCFRLGELEIQVAPESGAPAMLVCRDAEGRLAGSVLTQDSAVRNMVALAGITLQEAVTMASWNPARLLGIEKRKGSLQPGADADFVVMERDGAVTEVMIGGIGTFA